MTQPSKLKYPHKFQMRLSEEDFQDLRALAEQNVRNPATEIRLALRAWIATHKQRNQQETT